MKTLKQITKEERYEIYRKAYNHFVLLNLTEPGRVAQCGMCEVIALQILKIHNTFNFRVHDIAKEFPEIANLKPKKTWSPLYFWSPKNYKIRERAFQQILKNKQK